jgi:hypothetical protein
MDSELVADRGALRHLVNGFMVSQALHALVSLGIADALGGGPLAAHELAQRTGTQVDPLYRLLRAMAAQGVLEERPDRVFALTALGDGLRSDAPLSIGGWARHIGRPYYWDVWSRLSDAVRTGDHAFRMVHGTDVWTYRSARPEESAIFSRAMTALAGMAAQLALQAYDFGRFRRIVDVGGAQGAFIAAILARNPHLQGVLFDQPHVVAGAGEVLNAAGVADRCEVVSGSFFEEVPSGADAYILKSVLHDWYDPEAERILSTCVRAMGPDATLLIMEPVVGPPNADLDVKLADLNMFVAAGGKERTAEEWKSLLGAAALSLRRIVPTGGTQQLIEAGASSSAAPGSPP